MALTEEIFATLSDSGARADVEQFMSLLRRVPGLRQWFRAVSLDMMARQKLDAYLDGKITLPLNLCAGRRLLGWIAGTKDVAEDEVKRLQGQRVAADVYGGLSRIQIIALIRRYQAGRIDCASFLVAQAWRRELANGKGISPATIAATMQLLNAAISGSRPQLLHHFAMAADFFDGQKIGTIKGPQFGHSAWWKLNLLGYMLAHPKPKYRISEFLQCLRSIKLNADPSDIRLFCRRHKIARDTNPGRPRNPARKKKLNQE